MAEALGLTASIVAVLQITHSVLSVCYDYSAALKGASWELTKAKDELEGLRSILQALEPLMREAEVTDPAENTKLPTLEALCRPGGVLQTCAAEMQQLERKLKGPDWSEHFGPRRKAFLQSLRWPLQEGETRKTLERIARFRDTLGFAMNADATRLTLAVHDLELETNETVLETNEYVLEIKDAMLDVQSQADRAKLENERKAIKEWLSAPDPSINHTRAYRSRQKSTGLWFLDGETFACWEKQGSLVWLYGIPGCGKTVLSSAIVEQVNRKHPSASGLAVIYFYFDFNDVSKQKPENMVRSLLLQLSEQSAIAFERLKTLRASCSDASSQPDKLTVALVEIIRDLRETFIVIDALDESGEREQLFNIIKQIRECGSTGSHMLLTSRNIPDIEESLSPLTDPKNRVRLGGESVDPDILAYINERLQNDRGLRRWKSSPDVQDEIRTTLMEKADGMFRWTVCQLDALQNCPRLPLLRSALKNLPRSLDETYCRILCNIPEQYAEDAYKMLQWLTYSVRPLAITELAEVVAVNVDGSPWFECEARFPDPTEILSVLSSLVTTEVIDISSHIYEGPAINIVRLAHFSVQEYLVSDRILQQTAKDYAIQEVSANSSLAATCLAYLLQFDRPISGKAGPKQAEFPLANYAAVHWVQHLRPLSKDHMPVKLILELMLTRDEARRNWDKIYNRRSVLDSYFYHSRRGPNSPPLCLAAWAGLIELVRLLLEHGEDINAESGEFGNALQAAASRGHKQIVGLLLEEGADVNARGEYGTALQVAASWDHKQMVELLLKEGADVNAQGGKHGAALQAAASEGNKEMVELLLKEGADVNAQGEYGTALQAASSWGYKQMVELLLKEGADVNAQGGEYGTALQAAAWGGNKQMVELLLKEGADVYTQGGKYGAALQVAASEGNKEMVELLLKEGADVNAQGGKYGAALQTAAFRGNKKMVELLLKEGADVNIQGGEYGTALQAASLWGHKQIVELLLKEGADVNAQGGEYGTALQAAAWGGNKQMVELLLKEGADVHAQGGEYSTALQAAAFRGNKEIIELLLNDGADVNTQGGEYGTALQATAFRGNKEILELLLKEGADVHTQGGEYSTALQAAAMMDDKQMIVELLLKEGVDVYVQGGEYGTALQAAAIRGNEQIVELLLKEGADVNAQGGEYGTALRAAAIRGNKKTLQLLEHSTAVRVAATEGWVAVVQLLLKEGAVVTAQDLEDIHLSELDDSKDGNKVMEMLQEAYEAQSLNRVSNSSSANKA
ncbi:MAG: hypothetical protein Q9201_000428 [Fulgogasparrea decipioides]